MGLSMEISDIYDLIQEIKDSIDEKCSVLFFTNGFDQYERFNIRVEWHDKTNLRYELSYFPKDIANAIIKDFIKEAKHYHKEYQKEQRKKRKQLKVVFRNEERNSVNIKTKTINRSNDE